MRRPIHPPFQSNHTPTRQSVTRSNRSRYLPKGRLTNKFQMQTTANLAMTYWYCPNLQFINYFIHNLILKSIPIYWSKRQTHGYCTAFISFRRYWRNFKAQPFSIRHPERGTEKRERQRLRCQLYLPPRNHIFPLSCCDFRKNSIAKLSFFEKLWLRRSRNRLSECPFLLNATKMGQPTRQER